jgi:hypothetical protein
LELKYQNKTNPGIIGSLGIYATPDWFMQPLDINSLAPGTHPIHWKAKK